MSIRSKEEFFIVRTDARCTNQKLGSLLADYLLNNLTATKRSAFDRHRRGCVACNTAVYNARNLIAYLRCSGEV